jgi:ATP-dependent RNA helicase SUPV3L1/SUV3
LCGDPRAKKLIEDLCMRTGDFFEIKEYNRLSELKVENKTVKSFKDLRSGDCIVAFNR